MLVIQKNAVMTIYMFSDIAAAHATADEVEQKNTVLTVPYHFSLEHRGIVSKCAELAGFHVVQVKIVKFDVGRT